MKTYLDWIRETPVRDTYDNIRPDYDVEDPFSIRYRDSVIPSIVCNDGEHVSVQASETHYCMPRNNEETGWFEMEAGFPSCVPPLSWKEYTDGEWTTSLKKRLRNLWRATHSSASADIKYKESGNYITKLFGGAWRGFRRGWYRFVRPAPCTSVYGYLPIEYVREFIDVHGGEDTDKCFDVLRKFGSNRD